MEIQFIKSYLRAFSVSLIGILFCISLINVFINPYDLVNVPRVTGLSEIKPGIADRARLVKPYQAVRAQPRTVIAGNSRPEMGLNPESSCWNEADKPVYNFGVPGAEFGMQTLYARHALSKSEGGRVILGVDFTDFLTEIDDFESGPTPAGSVAASVLRLSPKVTGISPSMHRWQVAKDYLSALFSLNALQDSFWTVFSQRNPYSVTRTQMGFNPANDFIPIIRNEGQAILFQQKKRELAQSLSRKTLTVRRADGKRAPAFDELETFLSWSSDQSVDTILYISPYHLDYFQAIYRADLWSDFEDWKSELAQIAERHQADLWDFNSVDEFSTEPEPAMGDRENELKWFWEPAHYRSEMGELMLSAILGRPCASSSNHSGVFGEKLALNNLIEHIEKIRVNIEGRVLKTLKK